jgi:hypothetical protein
VDDTGRHTELRRGGQRKNSEASELQVRLLVDMLDAALDDATTTRVLDFVDHDEMGLALEWIFDYLVEHRPRVPIGVPPTVEALAARMSLTSRDWRALDGLSD